MTSVRGARSLPEGRRPVRRQAQVPSKRKRRGPSREPVAKPGPERARATGREAGKSRLELLVCGGGTTRHKAVGGNGNGGRRISVAQKDDLALPHLLFPV